MSTASDDIEDAHTRLAPDATLRNVDSTNSLGADRFANRGGDSQEPCVQNSAVLGCASSRFSFLNNAVDAKKCGVIDGAPHDEHVRELHTTLANFDPNAWSNLIYLALMQAPGHQMSLQEIYTWIIQHTDKVKEPSAQAWKNSVRHHLSIDGDFIRVSNATLTEECHAFQGWTIRPSALQRGKPSTTSHRKHTRKETSVNLPGGNDRGNRNFILQNYTRVFPDRSAPQSILENMTHGYYAERKKIVSEPFDQDLENYSLDRYHVVSGPVKAGDPLFLDRSSSSFQSKEDVPPSIDRYGHAAPSEIWLGESNIRIMFTQAALEGFIRLWEMHQQGTTSTHESLEDNTQSKPDINELCSRLIQLQVMKGARSGLGSLFDLYRARLNLAGFYEAYEEFKAQAQAESTAGGRFRHHRAVSVDDPYDPVALRRARNALAARKARHKKNQLIEELTNRVKELEADLEQTWPRQESIALGTDKTERDVSGVGVASVVNNLLVDCLNARNGQIFTPKRRANQKKEIVRFSMEARKYALFIKSFGLGILALMPQQYLFKCSERVQSSLPPSTANANGNRYMKQKDSDMERDILSFVNENPRAVEFCRIIEEEYMTIARSNSDKIQLDPRHDVRLRKILASISPGASGNCSQQDPLAKCPNLVPGQGADSRMVRGHMHESHIRTGYPVLCAR